MGSKVHCRWALLGLSNIATQFVDDLLLKRDATDPISHQIACVSTTGTSERAKSWLGDRPGLNIKSVTIYTSADEMLESGDFDIVYISTPHPLHYSLALKAINSKRNVLVEKPATMNAAQFENLAKLAKEKSIVFMETMWTRYLPAVLYLQQHLLPKIGSVKRVFSDLSVPLVSKEMPLTSRVLDKKAGAGALLDMGVYALTWIDVAFGGSSAAKVHSASSIPYHTGKEPIDDINTVLITTPDSGGAVGIATTSLTLPGSKKQSDKLAVKKIAPSVRIEATNAQVCIHFPLIRPQELHIEWYNEDNLDEEGREKHEIVQKPVERGWGLWYQADLMAREVDARQKMNPAPQIGMVIGETESLRILSWMDTVRRTTGIVYDAEDEVV